MLWPQVMLLQAATNGTAPALGAATGSSLLSVALELTLSLGAIAVIGTLLTRFVRGIARRAGVSKQVVSSITEIMGVLMLLAGVGVISTVSGLSSYFTALTISGIAGLAISLALQTTLSNVISGVLMLHDGVIHVGDEVQYGGPGGLRGSVIRISLRSTWLKTKDGVIAVIGNTSLAAGPLINHSATQRLEKKLEL